MDFFEAVERRRSVRRYTSKPVPPEVVERAIDAALLAPNSSNLQTWRFFWVRSPEKKAALVHACLSQGAAATAQELLVVVADRSLWKKTNAAILEIYRKAGGPKLAFDYYGKLIPLTYGWAILSPLRWLVIQLIGLFRPIARRPWSPGGVDEVAIKSAALAAENFMLAITAQGFDTCPMEGFDEFRVKKLLKLGCAARVVMVISVGERSEKGVWGQRVRFDRDWFVQKL